MKFSRRDFLKAAGVSLAVLSAKPALSVVAPAPSVKGGSKRWAMAIDLTGCAKKESCRDCIDACHRVHNVPHFENAKDEVKWIWSSPFAEVFPDQSLASPERGRTSSASSELGHSSRPGDFGGMSQQFLSVVVLCNHCENPPCVSVCPTKATFRRPDGIVMMDYHRCIGCRYCMAACPYGARSFNWKDPRPAIRAVDPNYPTRTRGVVEKCNFCDERLARGLQPACVEACNEKKLVFGDMSDPASELRRVLAGRVVLRRKPGLGTGPNIYYLI
jgi:Fe-S-cluster-containing dehydrogenase component